MHKILDETLQEAQNHAVLIQRLAERVRHLTSYLLQDGLITEAQRAQIEQCSHSMQQAAEIILDSVEFAHQQPEHSTEAYGLAAKYYIQASQQHFKTTQILIDAQKSIEWQNFKAH